MRGIAVIPEGEEAEALKKLPVAALGLDEERAATFALWGIGTLGELAALPEAELVARMGEQARRWRALARGEAEHAFAPIEAEFALEEFCEFETPVEEIDSLLFVGARTIECVVARAAGRALAIREMTAEMALEGGGTHRATIRPAVPSADRRFLLKLLQLEIGAHPPQAAVVSLTMRAEAGQQSTVQLGLFAPQTPEPSRLDVTLARLRALVGEERVGSPVLEDTHRAEGFRMEGFAIPGPQMRGTGGTHNRGDTAIEEGPRMALRRVRPARAVRVVLSPALSTKTTDQICAIPGPQMRGTGGTRRVTVSSTPSTRNTPDQICAIPGPQMRGTGGTQTSVMRPVAFSDGENRYEIVAAYGPWRTSGCWWALKSCDGAWDCEEWDVLAARAEKLSSGAKAPTYFASEPARLKSCPDTSCVADDIFSQRTMLRTLNAPGAIPQELHASGDEKATADPSTRFGAPGGCPTRQTSLRMTSRGCAEPASRIQQPSNRCDSSIGFGCGDGATIACLLVHDRARNAWRLEAFYD
jgi:hypothetical protein